MKTSVLAFLAICQFSVNASPVVSRQSSGNCQNTPTSRQCWGDYSIDTNYYETIFSTGVTREYWFSVENTTIAPDGYERYALTINGTVPGPAIIADWGDDVVIHVTNNMPNNGTSIHWHGIRQLETNEFDGVPGVTQCPIAPGDTLTYKWHANQYGTTWYHSHFSLQYGDGLFGPILINGPATANYDVDLGVMHLSDWNHRSVFELWDYARQGVGVPLDNGLINGTNTYNCTGSTDPNCLGTGKKWQTTFTPGQKYRLRLVNSAVEGHFQFSIDGHSLQVIANDLVPIVPYTTTSLLIAEGQRYDVIIEANAVPGDYWLRGGWQLACAPNNNAANITGIIRYSSNSTADPTSTGITVGSSCLDEPLESLVPHVALDVGDYGTPEDEQLGVAFASYAMWTLNSSSLYLNWSDPTDLRIYNNQSIFPTDYNVLAVDKTNITNWTAIVIEDKTGIPLDHPIHLHGHDYFVLAQSSDAYNSSAKLNLVNPPRRDTASLPHGGYLVLAWPLDNPGSWLMHCHIAWHASEGFALQFVESESEIQATMTESQAFSDTCAAWDSFYSTEVYPQDDSGI